MGLGDETQLSILRGSGANARRIPVLLDAPTIVLGTLCDKIVSICAAALDAHVSWCRLEGRAHNYVVGLDLAVAGRLSADGTAVHDIEPILIEGGASNHLPLIGYIPERLDELQRAAGLRWEQGIETVWRAGEAMSAWPRLFREVWAARGGAGDPVVGIFTLAPECCREEPDNLLMLERCRAVGLDVVRVTPADQLTLEGGRIRVRGRLLDIGQRRFSVDAMRRSFSRGASTLLARSSNTLWINDFQTDLHASKIDDERAFRSWEARRGVRIPRPTTLLGDEINRESLTRLIRHGGLVVKTAFGSGGAGVEILLAREVVDPMLAQLYGRYGGGNTIVLGRGEIDAVVTRVINKRSERLVQEFRVLDARPCARGRLLYDLRVNAVYAPMTGSWRLVSGFSRVSSCDLPSSTGSLLTNVHAGGMIAPLVAGRLEPGRLPPSQIEGPLIRRLRTGRTSWWGPRTNGVSR